VAADSATAWELSSLLEHGYRRQTAYVQSNLANLLFTYELQRRLEQSTAATIALAAHPGGARTALNRHMPALFRRPSWGLARPITHPAEIGALSILRAAVDPHAEGGEYCGPTVSSSTRATRRDCSRALFHTTSKSNAASGECHISPQASPTRSDRVRGGRELKSPWVKCELGDAASPRRCGFSGGHSNPNWRYLMSRSRVAFVAVVVAFIAVVTVMMAFNPHGG
jgi:hypothetical protein